MKVYKDLGEALKSIDFVKNRDSSKIVSLGFSREYDVAQFNLDHLFSWIDRKFSERNIPLSFCHDSAYLFDEVVKNAYEHGIEPNSKQKVLALSYVGNKGCLFGTKQFRNFLDDLQIETLTSGKPIHTTSNNPDSGNYGTFDLVGEEKGADGLLIMKDEMEIYFSKYFI